MATLEGAGVSLNDAARILFADKRFGTAVEPTEIDTVWLTVAELGLPNGAAMPEVCSRAAERGLWPCPLEVGPHLRLAWLDQPEGHRGHPPTRHRAPPGSLTIVSTPLDDTPETPRGFYLRRIDGVLWLRGYVSDDAHVWAAEDRLVFARRAEPPDA